MIYYKDTREGMDINIQKLDIIIWKLEDDLMSMPEDESLFSYYFISQSSQKLPYQKGIEDYQGKVAEPIDQVGPSFSNDFILADSDYGVKREKDT